MESYLKNTQIYDYVYVCMCVCVQYVIILYIYIHSYFEGLLILELLWIFLYQYISFISSVNKCTHLGVELLSNGEYFYIAYKYVSYFQKTLLISAYTTLTPINTVYENGFTFFTSYHKISENCNYWSEILTPKIAILLPLLCPLIVFIFVCLDFPNKFWNIEGIRTTSLLSIFYHNSRL